jgi:hypothetical protein
MNIHSCMSNMDIRNQIRIDKYVHNRLIIKKYPFFRDAISCDGCIVYCPFHLFHSLGTLKRHDSRLF